MRISIECIVYLIMIIGILGLFSVTPSNTAHRSIINIDDSSSRIQFVNTPVTPPAREELSNYSISVEFFPLTHQVTGWINISYLNNENITLDEVYLHIWGNDHLYNAVTILTIVNNSNIPLEHVIHNYVNLIINIPGGIQPDYRYSVNIHFSVEFSFENEDRFGYIMSPHVVHAFGNWHPVISVHENGSWNQNPYAYHGEAFYTELAYYDVIITAPEDEVIAAGGDLDSTTINGGKKTWHWTAGPIRDFTWVASPDYQVSSMNHDGIDIYSYYFPEHQERGESALNITKNSVDLFSELYDPWQYKTMVVVELQAWFGGMEYCQLVMISHGYYSSDTAVESFESVLSHEWSHNWNTYIVGNDPWKEPWLDEGWAMYSSILYAERYHGMENAKGIISYHKQGFINHITYDDDLPLILSMDYWENSGSYGYGVYVKGELVIDLLRYVMGDEAFFSSIQAFYEDYAYKTGVCTEDLLLVFEETSGLELSWFFNQFIYNPGIPRYNISLAEFYFDYPAQEYLSRISIEQEPVNNQCKMPLCVTVEFTYGPNENYVYVMNGSTLDIVLNLSPAGFVPTRIILDQDWMLMRDEKTISKEFTEIYSNPTIFSSSIPSSGVTDTSDLTTSISTETSSSLTSSIGIIPLLLAVLVLCIRKRK